MNSRALLIAGTDTGVGKTYVGCALARGLSRLGYQVGVMKPCETGVAQSAPDAPGRLPDGSDASALVLASGCVAAPELVRPYAFPLAAAPAVAAAAAGASIDLATIRRAFAALREAHDVLLVEAAGGLMVPLAPSLTWLDLAAHLRLPVLLVARAGLGTLNHTALSERAARAAGLRVLGIVVSCPDGAPSAAERSNLGALRGLVSSPVLAELPHAADPDAGACDALADAVNVRWTSS